MLMLFYFLISQQFNFFKLNVPFLRIVWANLDETLYTYCTYKYDSWELQLLPSVNYFIKIHTKDERKNKERFLNNKKIVFFFQENLELFFQFPVISDICRLCEKKIVPFYTIVFEKRYKVFVQFLFSNILNFKILFSIST